MKLKLNKVGIILFISSSIISIAMLEMGFRFSGHIFKQTREQSFFSKPITENPYDSERDYELFNKTSAHTKLNKSRHIWAIGDSFTNAGNVDSHESYPAVLFNLLKQNELNFSVTNLGQCEDPTWGVYTRLKNILAEYNKNKKLLMPEIVIILTGASDAFYYTYSGMDPLTSTREKQNIATFSIQNPPWFKRLRVYKAYRHIKLNLISRSLSKTSFKMTDKKINELTQIYNSILEQKPLSEEKWSFFETIVRKKMTKFREFVDGSTNEFKFKDKPRFVFNTLVIPRMRGFAGKLDYDKALKVMMKFGSDYPDYFWSDKRNAPFSLHTMSQLMLFQSQYTSQDMIGFLEDSTKKSPELRTSKLYTTAVKIFSKTKDIENTVKNNRYRIWKKIFDLSKKYKFKIVLQTYASNFTEANLMARETAKTFNLPIVDNHLLFKSFIKKYGKENIFADDNHFQQLGYQLMSKNIFKVLMDNKLLD